MRPRFRLASYIVLTVLAFGTLGKAPRLVTLRAQDLPPVASAAGPARDGGTSGE